MAARAVSKLDARGARHLGLPLDLHLELRDVLLEAHKGLGKVILTDIAACQLICTLARRTHLVPFHMLVASRSIRSRFDPPEQDPYHCIHSLTVV